MDRETCALGTALELGVSRCPACAGRRIPYRRARAALAYRAGARDVVRALKYLGARSLARPIAGRAVRQWQRGLWQTRGFWEVEQVTYVPLTRRRRADRGYNQAEVLARALACELDVPARPWLSQRQRTADQVGLDPSHRRANVHLAYELRAGVPETGHRVLLVDDVYTTGSTAHVCAGLLASAGWREVHVWTLARVVRGGDAGRRADVAPGRRGDAGPPPTWGATP